MLPRHKKAQDILLEIGKVRGYETRKSFTKQIPADAVWLTRLAEASEDLPGGYVPVLAAEVIVSEGKKSIRGSISTLEDISPALGVIVVHTDEVVASAIRRGCEPESARRVAQAKLEQVKDLASKSRQRIEVWDSTALEYRRRLVAKTKTQLG